jgi:hypothetical protein
LNLINKKVTHQQYGKGSVVNLSDSWIEVHFTNGNKRFVFPDAFGTYLKLADKNAAAAVKKLKDKKAIAKQKEEEALRKLRIQQQEERLRLLQRKHMLKNLKIHPSSQVAFWCNRDEQSRIFEDWKVFTGTIQSGNRKGQVRKLSRLARNSACLLTARNSSMPEKDRFVTGVYMVEDDFIGKQCEDGYIPAHPEHRLLLSEKESKKILFWNYYVNENHPQKMTWNAGRYRYMENIWVAQILRDIVSLKQDSDDKVAAENFFNYFCRLNHLNQDKLTKPNGALMRV